MRANRKLQASLGMITENDWNKIEKCKVLQFDQSKIMPYKEKTVTTLDNTRNNVIDLFK